MTLTATIIKNNNTSYFV